jgi:hypothetical protein
MDRCEREDAAIRFFCKVVDHIRVLEGDMLVLCSILSRARVSNRKLDLRVLFWIIHF